MTELAEIAQKLSTEVSRQITSEPQVVYILVGSRKLLEKNERLRNYPALALCCDWSVHSKLDRSSLSKQIIELFNRYEGKYRKEPVGVSHADMPDLAGFCDHSRFRAQLIDACESNGIDANAPRADEWWHSFLLQFSEVVRDCPLEAKAESKYITRVTASAIDPRFVGIFNRPLAISWTWYRKDLDTPGNVVSLF